MQIQHSLNDAPATPLQFAVSFTTPPEESQFTLLLGAYDPHSGVRLPLQGPNLEQGEAGPSFGFCTDLPAYFDTDKGSTSMESRLRSKILPL